DSAGTFSFQLGQNRAITGDASIGAFNEPGIAGLAGGAGGNPLRSSSPESQYWNCEIRARLAGYVSSSIPLAGRRFFSDPDIGVIVLRPIAGVEGDTVSATTGLAPKEAREELEDALDDIEDGKFDNAEKHLRKAVDLYEDFAAAWFELGGVLEQKGDLEQ